MGRAMLRRFTERIKHWTTGQAVIFLMGLAVLFGLFSLEWWNLEQRRDQRLQADEEAHQERLAICDAMPAETVDQFAKQTECTQRVLLLLTLCSTAAWRCTVPNESQKDSSHPACCSFWWLGSR